MLARAAVLLLALPLAAQAAHDVPHRGALVYNRTVDQLELNGPPTRVKPEWLVLDGSSATPQDWRWLACAANAVPANFEQPGFDDGKWTVGKGEFGPTAEGGDTRRSNWNTEVLCARTTIPGGGKKPRALWFTAQHDDGLRVWLNGKLLVADDGVGRGRQYIVTGAPLDAWLSGNNVLAAKCTNIGGAQYFDLAVGAFFTLPPGIKSGEDLQAILREEREQAERVRRELFGGLRAPAMLLQGELDDKRQYVPIAPADLRDLAWWLAMDLRTGTLGGAVNADAQRMLRLGDLQVRGKAGPADPDGWQVLELTAKSAPDLAPRNDSKRYLERHVRPFVWYGFDGTLRIRRRLDVRDNRVRVAEFTAELDGRVLRGKELAALLRQREQWRFQEARDNQDAEFRKRVRLAIERGCTKLREWIAKPREGAFGVQPDDAPDSYSSGRLALALLALVKGGAKDEPATVAAYAELRQRRIFDTYSLANAIMALEALYTPGNEVADLRNGVLDRPRKREVAAADLAVLQRWATALQQNIDTRVDAQYLLRFNYTRGDRFDNSVNQYGLLGLHSAHLCGVDIKSTVWEAAANHLLAAQVTNGEKFALELVDYRTLARRAADPDAPVSVARSNARTHGWSYGDPKDQGEWMPTWGSMTCAGITGLAICEAGVLETPGMKRVKLLADSRRARDDGFAWLAQNFTVRQHAGAIERQRHWYYYYLYSLERAALLSGVALLQDRDWYFEGAMMLVLMQSPDGTWPGELEPDQELERTAMAILFLKQSTAPVLTGR